MKLGHSILLGELIEATAVEYEDCRNFQITCPACHEPVFKGVIAKSETHYFSHYEKSRSLTAECEMRVGSITLEEIRRAQKTARFQRLELFLKVFHQALGKVLEIVQNGFEQPASARAIFHRTEKSKPVKMLGDAIYRKHLNGFSKLPEEELNEIFESYLEDHGVELIKDYFWTTNFSVATQKRIAGDCYRHLLASNVRENFDYLFRGGYFMLQYRILIKKILREPDTESFEPMMDDAVAKLPDLNRERGAQFLDHLSATPIKYRSGKTFTLLGKISSEISHEMFGLLLRIDYLRILAENSAKTQ